MSDMPPAGSEHERDISQNNKLRRLTKNRARRTLRTFLKVFLLTIFCLFAALAGAALNFSRTFKPPEIPASPTFSAEESVSPSQEDGAADLPIDGAQIEFERFASNDRKESFFTFLIIGLNEGTNANTVMVASYDGVNEKANLVSIPRDSLMNVTRTGRKISSSYMVGAAGGRGVAGGVAQMQREIKTVIGFVPDFYIVIDYDAFFAIIDAVGGIEVDVPFHMRYSDRRQNL